MLIWQMRNIYILDQCKKKKKIVLLFWMKLNKGFQDSLMNRNFKTTAFI